VFPTSFALASLGGTHQVVCLLIAVWAGGPCLAEWDRSPRTRLSLTQPFHGPEASTDHDGKRDGAVGVKGASFVRTEVRQAYGGRQQEARGRSRSPRLKGSPARCTESTRSGPVMRDEVVIKVTGVPEAAVNGDVPDGELGVREETGGNREP